MLKLFCIRTCVNLWRESEKKRNAERLGPFQSLQATHSVETSTHDRYSLYTNSETTAANSPLYIAVHVTSQTGLNFSTSDKARSKPSLELSRCTSHLPQLDPAEKLADGMVAKCYIRHGSQIQLNGLIQRMRITHKRIDTHRVRNEILLRFAVRLNSSGRVAEVRRSSSRCSVWTCPV